MKPNMTDEEFTLYFAALMSYATQENIAHTVNGVPEHSRALAFQVLSVFASAARMAFSVDEPTIPAN